MSFSSPSLSCFHSLLYYKACIHTIIWERERDREREREVVKRTYESPYVKIASLSSNNAVWHICAYIPSLSNVHSPLTSPPRFVFHVSHFSILSLGVVCVCVCVCQREKAISICWKEGSLQVEVEGGEFWPQGKDPTPTFFCWRKKQERGRRYMFGIYGPAVLWGWLVAWFSSLQFCLFLVKIKPLLILWEGKLKNLFTQNA